jgi:ferredoxin
VPRKIGSRLWLFDCINCDKCLPVCPNDANFVYETSPLRQDWVRLTVRQGELVSEPGGTLEIGKAHQIANFQDFCNDCGNCDVFCPEDGGPYLEKPRFFGSLEAWQRLASRDGFFVTRQGECDVAWARLAGREYRLRVDRERDRGFFSDGVVEVEVLHRERRTLAARLEPPAEGETRAVEGHTLDLSAYLKTAVALDGVLDPRRLNPVNAAC